MCINPRPAKTGKRPTQGSALEIQRKTFADRGLPPDRNDPPTRKQGNSGQKTRISQKIHFGGCLSGFGITGGYLAGMELSGRGFNPRPAKSEVQPPIGKNRQSRRFKLRPARTGAEDSFMSAGAGTATKIAKNFNSPDSWYIIRPLTNKAPVGRLAEYKTARHCLPQGKRFRKQEIGGEINPYCVSTARRAGRGLNLRPERTAHAKARERQIYDIRTTDL